MLPLAEALESPNPGPEWTFRYKNQWLLSVWLVMAELWAGCSYSASVEEVAGAS